MMKLAQVIIANSSQSFSTKLNSLTYGIPEELQDKIRIGSFVVVPYGKQVANGLVIELIGDEKTLHEANKSEKTNSFQIKEIDDVIFDQAVYSPELVELIKYTADYYACNYEEVLNAALPSEALKKPEKEIKLKSSPTDSTNEIILALKKARGNKAKFSRLKTLTGLTKKDLQKQLNKLEKLGLIEVNYLISNKKSKNAKNPIERFNEINSDLIPELTSEQRKIVEYIDENEKSNINSNKFLIHGVTGSGKTEIYLRLIQKCFEANQSTLVLVPEISLAPQIIERIAQRFGDENVLIWHSALNASEKLHTWNELMKSAPKVVVGARSAIWAPIKNLGLIVIDEEHENSYKQDSPSPRYDARTLAIKLSELNHCPIVFGSATPSIDIYYKAQSSLKAYDDYHLLELKERVFKTALPKVHVIDMREEFLEGNKSIFSKKLKQQVNNALEKKEQVILFLNRRGSASHVFCRTCGYVYKCKNCDSKMIYHEDIKFLLCHHCGHKEAHPQECPECSMPTIKFFGLGTQKLVIETQRTFPNAKIDRLDSDTSKIKHNYLKVWQEFKEGKIDILIGTQMVAKGLDLANVSTVGVISADSNFSQLDYQAEERGFQLLTQVTGRAGRKDNEGVAVFQTYQPERTVLQTAKEQDYSKFYTKEIQERSEFNYPPFSSLVRFVSSSEDLVEAIEAANDFHEKIYQIQGIEILGPSPCGIPRINKKHRQHILVKIPKSGELNPQEDLDHLEKIEALKKSFKDFKTPANVNFSIDINNINLY